MSVLSLSIGQSKNPVQEALLIKAQSRIVQLESEVSTLRQEAMVDKVKQDFSYVASVTDVERQNQLEKERCALVEEVAGLKANLADAEKLQVESDKRYQVLSERYHLETQTLKGQVENLIMQINELDSLNDEMQSELNEIRMLQPESQLEQVEEVKENYTRSVEGLKTRIAQLETVESKLLSSQAEVRHLQHQLRMYRQDTHFVEGVQQQLMDYESLQHQFRSLMEEKNSLAQDRANSDLLRYQVQSLQHRCEELEGVMEEVAKLQVENTRLQLKEGNGKDTSTSVLQAQLVELQQREIVSLHKHGELTTQLKVCEEKFTESCSKLQLAQERFKIEKSAVAAAEEKIQKLERRLIFVTKEREGCIKVLSSYKLDSGVDGVIRELLAEREQDLERSKVRISELESELLIKEELVQAALSKV